MSPIFLDITTFLSKLLKSCQINISGKIQQQELERKHDRTIDEIKKQQQIKERIQKEENDKRTFLLQEENWIKLEMIQKQNEVAIAKAKADTTRHSCQKRGRRFCSIC